MKIINVHVLKLNPISKLAQPEDDVWPEVKTVKIIKFNERILKFSIQVHISHAIGLPSNFIRRGTKKKIKLKYFQLFQILKLLQICSK